MQTGTDRRPEARTWALIRRALLSAIAVALMAGWLFWSSVLAELTCDENCDSATHAPEWWGWEAQFVLAAVGAGLGVAALVLGFTSKLRAFWAFAMSSLICLATWIFWVAGSGSFD